MTQAEVLGLVAASLTTLSFLPQAVMVFRTRNTDGISLTMYAMFTLGVALWFGYGVMTLAWPVIIANAVTFVLAAAILTIKARNVLAERAQAHQAGIAPSATPIWAK